MRHRPAVRRNDPDTSHAAFASLDTTAKRRYLFERLNDPTTGWNIGKDFTQVGFTTLELADAIGVARDCISSRITEMSEEGLVNRTEMRRAYGGSKRKQIVWTVNTLEDVLRAREGRK